MNGKSVQSTHRQERGSLKRGGRSERRWSWTALSDDGAWSHLSVDDWVSRRLKQEKTQLSYKQISAANEK